MTLYKSLHWQIRLPDPGHSYLRCGWHSVRPSDGTALSSDAWISPWLTHDTNTPDTITAAESSSHLIKDQCPNWHTYQQIICLWKFCDSRSQQRCQTTFTLIDPSSWAGIDFPALVFPATDDTRVTGWASCSLETLFSAFRYKSTLFQIHVCDVASDNLAYF